MKKILLVVVSLLMVLACGNQNSDAVNGKNGSQPADNKQVYKIGVTQFMEHPSLNLAKKDLKMPLRKLE